MARARGHLTLNLGVGVRAQRGLTLTLGVDDRGVRLRKALELAAERAGMSTTTWVRTVLIVAATGSAELGLRGYSRKRGVHRRSPHTIFVNSVGLGSGGVAGALFQRGARGMELTDMKPVFK